MIEPSPSFESVHCTYLLLVSLLCLSENLSSLYVDWLNSMLDTMLDTMIEYYVVAFILTYYESFFLCVCKVTQPVSCILFVCYIISLICPSVTWFTNSFCLITHSLPSQKIYTTFDLSVPVL